MLPLTGYADRLSVRPGETIRFHLANATSAEVQAKLVRVICADGNPGRPRCHCRACREPPRRVRGRGRGAFPARLVCTHRGRPALLRRGQLLGDVPRPSDTDRERAPGDRLAYRRRCTERVHPRNRRTGPALRVNRRWCGDSRRGGGLEAARRAGVACRVARRGHRCRRGERRVGGDVAPGSARCARRTPRELRSPPAPLPPASTPMLLAASNHVVPRPSLQRQARGAPRYSIARSPETRSIRSPAAVPSPAQARAGTSRAAWNRAVSKTPAPTGSTVRSSTFRPEA